MLGKLCFPQKLVQGSQTQWQVSVLDYSHHYSLYLIVVVSSSHCLSANEWIDIVLESGTEVSLGRDVLDLIEPQVGSEPPILEIKGDKEV